MNEGILVAAVLESRKAYENIIGSIDYEDFSEYARMVIRYADEYYRGDPAAQQIDRDTVASALGRHFPNPKQTDRAVAWLEKLSEPSSAENVAREYRLLQRHNVALELAAQLGAGNHGPSTDTLIGKYVELGSPAVAEETERARLNVEELEETIGDGTRIKLLPGALNDAIGGGVLRGHNIVVYARPETGKTLLAITMGFGFTQQGLKVLHTGNEEPLRDLHYRYLSRMSRIPVTEIYASRERLHAAIQRAESRGGWKRLALKELTTARMPELEALVRRYKPDVLIVDQIKNLKVNDKSGNRALELDLIAQEIRRMGKEYDMVTVNVTQAGESAEGKLKLELGDVEWSNTGIPGAADLMIGMGVNDEYAATNRRAISLPKNKINGQSGSFFPVFVEPQYSACLSKPLRSK